MADSSPQGQKTLWEKEKLLLTSNFSFSHRVFERHVLQTRKNKGLFGKGFEFLTGYALKDSVYCCKAIGVLLIAGLRI